MRRIIHFTCQGWKGFTALIMEIASDTWKQVEATELLSPALLIGFYGTTERWTAKATSVARQHPDLQDEDSPMSTVIDFLRTIGATCTSDEAIAQATSAPAILQMITEKEQPATGPGPSMTELFPEVSNPNMKPAEFTVLRKSAPVGAPRKQDKRRALQDSDEFEDREKKILHLACKAGNFSKHNAS